MFKFAATHEFPKGPGDARPTALQIIQNEGLEGNLAGKVILITGCSSGLGVESAHALLHTGATVFLTARDVQKAKTRLGAIVEDKRVRLLHLDLASLASVRKCADELKSKTDTLHILIENAGVMACPKGQTVDGFETHFGTNHIAHALLFYLLEPLLIGSSERSSSSRVVIVSSSAHRLCKVNFDNLNLDDEYEPWKAYGQSKIANVWMANAIDRRYSSHGLRAFSVHPGLIQTELLRYVPDDQRTAMAEDRELAKYWKSPEQGAATIVWAAVSAELEGQGGNYLDDCQIAGPWEPPSQYTSGHAPWAYSPDDEERLWEVTLALLDAAGG